MFDQSGFIVLMWLLPVILFIIIPLAMLLIWSVNKFAGGLKTHKTQTISSRKLPRVKRLSRMPQPEKEESFISISPECYIFRSKRPW
jgi:ABC-type multidrug transport system fused ATPase/permease subunit